MAQELGAGYVDAHGAFQENRQQEPLFLADGVHLSEAGYAVWADAITPFLP
jgi:lysophospholipase L1-like esterase